MKVTVDDVGYTFDGTKDCVLKYGLYVEHELSDKEEWVVVDDFILWSARLQSVIIIPTWFITDLTSVPRFLRFFIPVNGKHRLASLPHDLFYTLEGIGYNPFSRANCDQVFKDFCLMRGVSKTKTNLMYIGLRLGGWTRFGHTGGTVYLSNSYKEFYINKYPDLYLSKETKYVDSLIL